MRHAVFCLATFLVGVLLVAPVPHVAANPDYVSFLNYLDTTRAMGMINDLAGDQFEGRRAGTHGADLASEYIGSNFKAMGLQPAGTDGTYRTGFTMPLWELAEIPSIELMDPLGNTLQNLVYRKDFTVIPGSGGGDDSAEVVFGGYGTTVPSLGYDDYSGISVRGKIILAMVGSPASDQFTQDDYAPAYVKAENALSHGAVGLILVDSPADPTPNYMKRQRCGCCWTFYQGLTILGGSVDLADILLEGSGVTLKSLQRTIDETMEPKSFPLGKQLHMHVQVQFTTHANAYNVLGFIPGSDPSASEKAVIIGAHYDHWGKDVDGSIFRGANDDASGVAVMMEIARLFSAGAIPKLSVLFAAWSGEEEGFYGAYAYVSHPYFSLRGTLAYLNLDMVGYGERLLAEVSEAHEALRAITSESAGELGISILLGGYSGGSDHSQFEERGVPNLMFIYWPDEVYHTPGDTTDHVSKANLLGTARLTALVALRLSEAIILPITSSTATSHEVSSPTILPVTSAVVVVGIAFLVVATVGVLHVKRYEKRRNYIGTSMKSFSRSSL